MREKKILLLVWIGHVFRGALELPLLLALLSTILWQHGSRWLHGIKDLTSRKLTCYDGYCSTETSKLQNRETPSWNEIFRGFFPFLPFVGVEDKQTTGLYTYAIIHSEMTNALSTSRYIMLDRRMIPYLTPVIGSLGSKHQNIWSNDHRASCRTRL